LLLLLQLLAATALLLQACLAERRTSIALLLVLVLLQAKHSVAAGARSCTASFQPVASMLLRHGKHIVLLQQPGCQTCVACKHWALALLQAVCSRTAASILRPPCCRKHTTVWVVRVLHRRR
jgi:hypothetical protein